MISNIYRPLSGVLLLLVAGATQASALSGCFSGPADYTVNYAADWTASDDVAGKTYGDNNHLLGSGPAFIEANCSCPSEMKASDTVFETTWAGSPLATGVAGYGQLTDKLDIDITGYSDSADAPDGNNLFSLNINAYPTDLTSMSKVPESKLNTTEGSASVCSDATRPDSKQTSKRRFNWNVIRATFYIKKPLLGVETIPPMIVAQNYSCLALDGSSCTTADATLVSNIWLTGTITVPLSCTINAGSTIEVELGNIVSSQFIAQGQPPAGYTLKDVDITWHCDNPAIGNSDKIKMTLTADQGVADSGSGYIAKMLNRDDVGVRMYDANSSNISLDGQVSLPIGVDDQGNGALHLQAAPVATTEKRPEPGKFEGNVTLKMDLR
ncbi:fimbrial protein [Yokenella regensburgei]|uniref:Fimbrial protein StgD n=1 Tax=Yokenella regensburgei TaxID=158877 RepID=A0AB38G296_9ENTR|nr:fimbrial protein [Yokenella regensburgei]SQA65167.1 fimbrial protein StgD [Yokenella regensburgei]SQA66400.1 fimbrial protein StgD [Yokenella regensburgei]SUQ05018.1 fimbrial protein StgD [Yokenella regensburgei]